nr:U3 small nucleolar RNA-associated protein 25 isoform [Cryptomonas paramecium]
MCLFFLYEKKLKLNFQISTTRLRGRKLHRNLQSLTHIKINYSSKFFFNVLISFFRNLISIRIIWSIFPYIFLNSYTICHMQFFFLFLNKEFVTFIRFTIETVKHVKNNFIDKIIYILKKKRQFFFSTENSSNSIVLIGNQTSLICFLEKIYTKIIFNRYTSVFLNKKKFRLTDFCCFKKGKMLYPADKRVFFCKKNNKLSKFGIIFSKKLLKVQSNTTNSSITFLSLYTICKFSKKKALQSFSNSQLFVFENLRKPLIFDIEYFLESLKKLIIVRKMKLKDNSIFKRNYIFEIFILYDLFYIQNFSILENIVSIFFYSFRTHKLGKKNIKCNITDRMLLFCKKKFIIKNLEKKFSFFISQFEVLIKSKKLIRLLIFVRTYLEYILIRNFVFNFKKTKKINFFTLNEYSNSFQCHKEDCQNNSITIVTEMSYSSRRYFFRELSDIFFYTYPTDSELYFEICSFLKSNILDKKLFLNSVYIKSVD